MKIHIVQKGDTLWKIAKKYGVNFEELKKMNSQLSNPDMIMPGMKVKVPTTGGHVKKTAPSGYNPGGNPGIKKEMPIAEHPYAKEKPKPLPIVEAPIKEAPIKEVPKTPFIPKMPAPVIPEIDINNYYMMNMANMTVQTPPPQPQVKEVPKKEVPVVPPPPPPMMEVPVECPPVEQPVCEPECVPVTPVMPGPGFCPPDGFPMNPAIPMSIPMPTAGMMPMMDPGMVPGMNPGVGGVAMMPTHFEDESSSAFMPAMPMMNPGAAIGAPVQQGGYPVQTPYLQPGAGYAGQMPAGYQPGPYQGYPAPEGYMQGAYPVYPEAQQAYPQGTYQGYPQGGYQGGIYPPPQQGYPGYQNVPYQGYPPGAYPGYPGEFTTQQGPRNDYLNPAMGPGFAAAPAMYPSYGQMPYGYPQSGPVYHSEVESSDLLMQGAAMQQPMMGNPVPAAMGGLNDCGFGAPQAIPQTFIPPTPPVYMAPYTAPSQFAQPPFMNPYGMEPMGAAPYGMPRDAKDSDENGS